MTHQRIRKFNTAQMYPGKKMDNDLSMAVRAGNRIFLRGQTGFDLEGNMTGIGDPAKQAETAMQCVKTLLEEAGSKLAKWAETSSVSFCTGREASARRIKYVGSFWSRGKGWFRLADFDKCLNGVRFWNISLLGYQ